MPLKCGQFGKGKRYGLLPYSKRLVVIGMAQSYWKYTNKDNYTSTHERQAPKSSDHDSGADVRVKALREAFGNDFAQIICVNGTKMMEGSSTNSFDEHGERR